jgi:hypothetical protein
MFLPFVDDCTDECEFLSPDHLHCTRCGGVCGVMGHLSCPSPKTPEAIEQARKRELRILVKQYKAELCHPDNNIRAIATYRQIKAKATPEEFEKIMQETASFRQS